MHKDCGIHSSLVMLDHALAFTVIWSIILSVELHDDMDEKMSVLEMGGFCVPFHSSDIYNVQF